MIKKISGILFLVIGLVAVALAAYKMTMEDVIVEVQIADKLKFTASLANLGIFASIPGLAILCAGLFFFVMGVLMSSRRTNAQRKLEHDYNLLKELHENGTFIADDLSSQIERLGRLKEMGYLTEEEFKREKGRVLNYISIK